MVVAHSKSRSRLVLLFITFALIMVERGSVNAVRNRDDYDDFEDEDDVDYMDKYRQEREARR